MTNNPDPIDQLGRALEQIGAIISRIGPEQGSLPTPCSSWDVRTLIDHVVQDIRLFTASARGEKGKSAEREDVGAGGAGAYRDASDSLMEAWRTEGAIDRTVELPFGQVPATWLVGQQIADIVVHGWDLARATGQSTDFDPELGQVSLDWARQNLKPEFRGDEASGQAFGPEVAVPDDAPIHDRLAGFFGRNPN